MAIRLLLGLCVLGHPAASATDVGTRAFYVLFADQIESPNWPEKLCQNNGVGPQGHECVDARKYSNGVFIASPQNMTRELITKVKRDVPGSSVLGYFDFGDIPLAQSAECPFCHGHIMGDRPGRNCSTTYTCGPSPFLTGLHKAFPNKMAVHDITDGLPGVMLESYWGLAKYVWTSASCDALADYLSRSLMAVGFDGLYVDGYAEPDRVDFHQCALKEEGCQSFMKPNRSYDIDGDGVADSPEEIYASYFAWAPAFMARMRAKFGPSGVVLANSAGSISDSSLSGVTIEMEACTGDSGTKRCADALNAQHTASVAAGVTPVSVLWLTHSESMPASKQCEVVAQLQQQYPWVQAGTDFFDGSHVVC
jgi:hypothetical protein